MMNLKGTLWCAWWLAAAAMARAVTFQTVHHFSGPPYAPSAPLVMATNGLLYGVTDAGGAHGQGAIFKITTNGVFSTVWSFTGGADGASPRGSLLSASDGALYGTATQGGTNGYGVIFKLTTAGVLTPLHSFSGWPGGSSPQGGLIQASDGALYGVTTFGGTSANYGTVFRITTGGVFQSLYAFAGTHDGAWPMCKLVQGPDNALYGTCTGRGSNDLGTVFRVTTNGALTPLWSFTGGEDGAYPYGGLAAAPGGAFLGQTYSGGTHGDGTVYRITTAGVMTPLWSFKRANHGCNPRSELWRSTNGWFYGTTTYGGTNWAGTIFKIATDGTFATLASLREWVDGIYPNFGLFQASDGAFYGVARHGGSNAAGTVFKFVEGSALTPLWAFKVAAEGVRPQARLVQGWDGALYGTATYGGSKNYGTVFRVGTDGSVSSLWSFTGDRNGCNPQAELLPDSNGVFFGVTPYCGMAAGGTGFRLSNNVMDVYHFRHSPTNAFHPHGGLNRGPDQAFYGVSYYGGISGLGTVYRISPDGGESLLHTFTGPNGARPVGTLAGGSKGVFYGVTQEGGVSNWGTVFRVTTNGLFTNLWHFRGAPDGREPKAGVILASDGALYGTTQRGGSNDVGTVFRVTTNGVGTVLYSFGSGFSGYWPQAPLLQGKDGALYGTTYYGGTHGHGTVFRITTNGQFTVLWAFTGGTNGGLSCAGLTEVGDWFYGTTTLNEGTIFRLSLAPSLYLRILGTGARVVTWEDPSYLLQSTTDARGVYTNIPGAVSPYTCTFTDPQRFFRLKRANAP